jgi:hypothetical protein
MTRVIIKIEADMRLAARAPKSYTRIAEAVERELRDLDSMHPTLGRHDPAIVTHCFVETEHGLLLGRAGRGDGWEVDAVGQDQMP